MDIKKYFFFGLILIILSDGYAAYLTNVPQKIVQPDGTIIHCFASGDEYHNWLHDSLDYTIIRNPQTGYFVYAISSGDDLVASDFVVGASNPVSLGLMPKVNISPEKWAEKRKVIESMTPKVPVRKSGNKNHGHINNLVFFLRFSDETGFNTDIYQDLVQSHNDSSSITANSMYNFYKLSSYGKFTVTTSFYPSSTSDVIYSYQDSLPRNYYLAYDSISNPNGYQGSRDRREREHSLLKRVIEFLADSIPVDLDLDFDNDGQVDNICFITSGSPEGWSGLMWPHRWSLSSDTVYLHGKRVYDYNFVMETYTYVGVLTHEFMHTLGAPDLYRYYHGLDITPVGSWDLMATTNYSQPQGLSAYMKYKYGNWVDTIIELREPGRYTIYPANKTSPYKTLYKITTSASDDDYLVLDYRTTISMAFESNIPGTGLLIYRINEKFNGNSGFDSVSVFDEVYLFRRNGTPTANGNINQAQFSQLLSRVNFDKNSNPYPFCTDGTIIEDIIITNVTAASRDSIQFTFLRSDTFLITKDELQLGYAAGAKDTFEIISNIDWELSNIPSWLTLNKTQGSKNDMIILTANEDNSQEIRLDTIFLSSTSISTIVPILVSQEYGTSIKEISNENLFELYPNPVSEKLHINITDAAMFSNISIYSITGQLVYHSFFANENKEIEIDVANLTSGVYFVKLYSQKNISSKRFIKQ
jgi:M6 family metalloprotease-like protein